MNIQLFWNERPRTEGSFLDRNPNIGYLITDESESILIDASSDPEQVTTELKRLKSTLKFILITHYHDDHISNLQSLASRFPEAKIGIHPYSLHYLHSRGFSQVISIENSKIFQFGNLSLFAIHTPGHTVDSISFWNREQNVFFSGDTLFGGGTGHSDYACGGNRIIFFNTLTDILKLLPGSTEVYPAHYSEYYNKLPPYPLSQEKISNPYLSNVLAGNRNQYDAILRKFSEEAESYQIVLLNKADIDLICSLEKQTWIPELQASRETFLNRLNRNHQMLTIKLNGIYQGLICWRYSDFSIADPDTCFPTNFTDFSLRKDPEEKLFQSAFIYNVGVIPSSRGQGVGGLLLQSAFQKIMQSGIRQVFVDSRLPSYNGSHQKGFENVPSNPDFKIAVDRSFSQQRFPEIREFSLDPRIRFYLRYGFRPWRILNNFIVDESSGNLRVICFISF